MTIEWSPDSCECILELSADLATLEDWAQKCHIHKGFANPDLLAEVKTHCSGFNNRFGQLSISEADIQEFRLSGFEKMIDWAQATPGKGTVIAVLNQIDILRDDKRNERSRIKGLGPPDQRGRP